VFHFSSGVPDSFICLKYDVHINLRQKDLLILGQPPLPVLNCLSYWSTPAMALTTPDPLEPVP
jgi:hypothetical protein